MRLSDRQLVGLPAVTQSGQQVGSVIGFECDTEHHTIETYLVSTSPFITRLFGLQRRTLAIARTQVIAITNEAMIVHDGVVTEQQPTAAVLKSQLVEPAPATPALFE